MINLYIEANDNNNEDAQRLLTSINVISENKSKKYYVNMQLLCNDTDFFYKSFTQFDKKLEVTLDYNEDLDIFDKYLELIHCNLDNVDSKVNFEVLHKTCCLLKRIASKKYKSHYILMLKAIDDELGIKVVPDDRLYELYDIYQMFKNIGLCIQEYQNIDYDLSKLCIEVGIDIEMPKNSYKVSELSNINKLFYIIGLMEDNKYYFAHLFDIDIITDIYCAYINYLNDGTLNYDIIKASNYSIEIVVTRHKHADGNWCLNAEGYKYILKGFKNIIGTKLGDETGINFAIKLYCKV